MSSQHFEIINLDKVQSLGAWSSLRSHFFVKGTLQNLFDILANDDPHTSWAGDRIICRGEDIFDYPSGLLTVTDRRFLASASFKRRKSPIASLKPSETFGVLRNLSKGQYVRVDGLGLGMRTGLALMTVLLSRICWSASEDIDLPGSAEVRAWPGASCIARGAWAGDRFDLQANHHFEREGIEWVDVTKKAARAVSKILSPTENTVVHRKISPPALSPFPPLPWEIISHILKEVAKESCALAAELCRVSRSAYRDICPILYRNPVVSSDRCQDFVYALEASRKRARSVGSMVINLYIHSPTPNLLSLCPNIKFLFFDWEGSTSSEMVSARPPNDVWPVPSTLFLGPLPRAHAHFGSISPLFQQVVRLCINHADIQSLLKEGPRSLPALTHLAIRIDCCDPSITFFDGNPSRYWQGVSPIQQVLRAFDEISGLQKLLLVFEYADSLYGEWWLQAAENIRDERVFARPRLREEEYERMMEFQPDEGTALRVDNESDFWDGIDSDWRGKVRESKINLAPLSDSDMERREYDRYFR